MTMTWRALDSDALERQYNPRVSVPDPETYFAENARLSAVTRAELECLSDVPYGRGALQRMDVFPASDPGSPVHLFFHGGYWRAQDKADYAFVARHLVPAGVTVVVANYDLCPAVTIADIELQALECLAFLTVEAERFNADPALISVSGHSAGGQLAARLLSDGRVPLVGALLISGVYDLEPLPGTTINAALGLDAASARRRSPLYWPAWSTTPTWLVVGDGESAEFKRQTDDFAAHLRAAGAAPRVDCVTGVNHFSVVQALFSGGCWHATLLALLKGQWPA